MQIQIDSREHKKELARIQGQLHELGVDYFVSKLYVGDYMNLDNPRVVVDRKKDLLELSGNICQQHERFQKELTRARDAGIKIIILCEHGKDITCLEDVYFWENPRREKSPNATNGETLYKALCTIRDRYGVLFEFCNKRQTGKRIIELLGGDVGG